MKIKNIHTKQELKLVYICRVEKEIKLEGNDLEGNSSVVRVSLDKFKYHFKFI